MPPAFSSFMLDRMVVMGGWHENYHDSQCHTTIQNENARGIFILNCTRDFHLDGL